MKNIKAKMQFLDNYVKEYEIKVEGKIDINTVLNLNCSLGFGIVKIEKNETNKIGQIQMVYDIKLLKESDNNEVGKIHLVMEALFEKEKELTNEQFEKMLKYNGAPILSQIMRAYIISNTSLNGMPVINIPIINFIEFFENNNKQ